MPRLPSLTPQGVKNLWIRTALFEKVLDKIVLYLVENSRYIKNEPMNICPAVQEVSVPSKMAFHVCLLVNTMRKRPF